jgi:4-methylaminobutanoate oxidase (formaldehyde-forming)
MLALSMSDLKSSYDVVIVGGGIVGCSVAYHLAKRGCRDVLLLERKRLTSGTTWHAAGLVAQLRATANLTQLARYSGELYAGLEAETGQATGFVRNGSMTLASNAERFEELRRQASMARCFGVEVDVVGPSEIQALWPLLHCDDLVGGVHLPGDANASPVDTTMALAKGATQAGVTIRENVCVRKILHESGRARGVETDEGPISARAVVNCGGMWAREIGRGCGVNVPLHAAEHFYVITDSVEGLASGLPTVRDPDAAQYFKCEAGGQLLIGFFELEAKPWGMEGIPEDFAFSELAEDWDHLETELLASAHRIPALGETGIRVFFNGPESFTPDDRYLLGEAPELRNFFVAAGFNSIGIQSAGGAGKVLADWILDGKPPMDLWDVDLRRMMPEQGNAKYLHDRTVETLGLLYAMHWPFRQFETARGVRKSPLHGELESAGACFGELACWERANWFAPRGVEPRYEYSYARQNWFEFSAAEHRAVRERVGLFDQSSFAKFVVEGKDAEKLLSHVCANDVAVESGRVVYTQWLNPEAGIEADLTVTRLDKQQYFVVTSPTSQVRDLSWLRRNTPATHDVTLHDVTGDWAVLSLMGPESRELLSALTDADLSNAGFPFGSCREIQIAAQPVRALRLTYVGELGFELYVPRESAVAVLRAIREAGHEFGLALAGYHALNSLRLEKGYRHWGHDISPDDDPLEAGLMFAVALDKPGGFIGHDALVERRERGVTRRLLQFALEDPGPLLYHDEPIWRDDQLVGRTTSGSFGHTLGAAVALGYVDCERGQSAAAAARGAYEIEVAGVRVAARASHRPWYDPGSARVRG